MKRSAKTVPIALLLATFLSAPALAEDPPVRMVTTTVYGTDPCPKPKGDEIIVCGRDPESERYRIPNRFRSGSRV